MAAYVPGGLERDAKARKRPLAQHFPVVAHVAAGEAHRARFAVGLLVFPRGREVAREQAIVPSELVGRARRTVTAQIVGARANHAPVGRELARRERRIGELRDADRHVEAFLDQIDRAVREA